jgi:hypothetical protein
MEQTHYKHKQKVTVTNYRPLYTFSNRISAYVSHLDCHKPRYV